MSVLSNSITDRVTVFGGTGFLGQYIVRHLAQNGYRVRVAVRHPKSHLFQEIDNIDQVQANVTDAGSVSSALEGMGGVVNAVGLYVETSAASFSAVHVSGAREVAVQAARIGAKVVHISGIGVDFISESRYVAARAAGEQAVREAAPDAVILRPSVLFGPNDAFLNSLLNLARYAPAIPLFGNGGTRLQPVHVADIAEAVVCVLWNVTVRGKTYELGGPRIYTYRELLETIVEHLGKKRLFVPVPFIVWKALAAASELLPNPPLTRDQIVLVSEDNVVNTELGTFRDLGVNPKPLEYTLSQMV
ncbi:complex I NDUFA9 subunit family protein [Gammaproteobacteria bacterium]|nr:complex I NDUFA9 subunit family protein [Gammaproteobacteria bacterium]